MSRYNRRLCCFLIMSSNIFLLSEAEFSLASEEVDDFFPAAAVAAVAVAVAAPPLAAEVKTGAINWGRLVKGRFWGRNTIFIEMDGRLKKPSCVKDLQYLFLKGWRRQRLGDPQRSLWQSDGNWGKAGSLEVKNN